MGESIVEIFDKLSENEPDRSTAYLMQMTVDIMLARCGRAIDTGDVVDELYRRHVAEEETGDE